MAALRFRFALYTDSHGLTGNLALTINADHSVGAGQIEHSGVAASAVLDRKVSTSRRTGKLPDILGQLQRETELTRNTLGELHA